MIPKGLAHLALFQGKTRRPCCLRGTPWTLPCLRRSLATLIAQVILGLRTSDSLPASKNASPLVPAPRRSPHPSHAGARLGCCASVPRSYLRKPSVFKGSTAFCIQEYITAGRHSCFICNCIAAIPPLPFTPLRPTFVNTNPTPPPVDYVRRKWRP